ncbi:MAG: M23 family metallopeptidase [Chloroflexota bacterium]|nr:MAG: M23 family metallopeptidase [Chloroflexota bacterium]
MPTPNQALLVLTGVLFGLLVGCQPNSGAPVVSLAPTTVSSQAPSTLPPPPPVIVTVSVSAERSSFSPLSEGELAQTATASAQARITQEATVAAEQATVPPPTETPLPTFTPPALPKTPDWEHYWLRRPVPEGSTVWTDKAYPYGSTRGGELRAHHGVEFNVPAGTVVMAAASGTVVTAGRDDDEPLGASNNFYGNVVVIQHDTGLEGRPVYSLYGHLSQILVQVGDRVNALDTIALSGASGVADGAHLHFEVRVGGNDYGSTRNPLLWLYPFPDRAVVAGRVTHPNGTPARNVPISLRRIDAPSPYAATTSYADDSVNPDDAWDENFALDDVHAGYYKLTAGTGDDEIEIEFWVHPYQTSFVEIVLENR